MKWVGRAPVSGGGGLEGYLNLQGRSLHPSLETRGGGALWACKCNRQTPTRPPSRVRDPPAALGSAGPWTWYLITVCQCVIYCMSVRRMRPKTRTGFG